MRNLVVLTVVALLPVALLSASSIVLASRQVTSVVNKQVQTTAAVSAVVVGQQMADLKTLLHSYATRPSLVIGVAGGGVSNASVEANLQSLALAVPGISASFVASDAGTSLYTYPLEPAVIGTNFAYRNWYTGLVATGHPYVSEAIVTKEAGNPLAVTITDYIAGPTGPPAGILGINYSLQSIAAYSRTVGHAQGITLTVTDKVGTSLTAGGAHGLVSLAADPRIRAALAGKTGLLEYAPVLSAGKLGPRELSAYAPVVGTGWAVIASIPENVAFAGLVRLRTTVLIITVVLVLILLAGIRFFALSDRRRRHSDQQVQSRDRELARILESTDEAFASIDAGGAVTAWNIQAEDLFGWGALEMIGRNLVDTVIPPSAREEYRRDLAGYREGAQSNLVGRRTEMAAVHHDGHEIPVEVSVWAHDTGNGFSAFVHDITARVAIQSELENARDQAMRASRLKSEFLANMSHEIRTPMNGVIGMSGLLLNTDLDATQRDYTETVCSSAEALLTVIDDILDFSKIEAGKLDVETVTFDLRSVVEEAAVLLAARAEQNGLELTCGIDPALPAALRGDPGRLRQVLLNLLGNAVKFTSKGEVNLSARLIGDATSDVVTVELSVRDTGIGMTEASLERLFDAFTQAESSTSRRYGGTGLGLAISRQLVELMGGTLTVLSALGSGSTFSAVIPFPVATAANAGPAAVDFVGVRALIVDDNVTNQRVLQEMVTEWGCIGTSVGSAAQALVLLRRRADRPHPFDVLLLDLNMPDVDGYELARLVRSDPRLAGLPMVMLTSSAQRGEAERTEQAGIAAYVTKPVRAAQLRAALNLALGPALLTTPRLGGKAPLPTPPAAARDSSSETVLLVEDNVVNQKVFSAMATSIGYGVDVAVNGFDALEAMDRRDYSAVFMDCQMPVMDGYQTTEKIREREGTERHTCIIAVTASAMAADRARCFDAGMDDYLTKPFKTEDLAAKLTHWLPVDARPAVAVPAD
jgi:PAS domain S-box-containing protein